MIRFKRPIEYELSPDTIEKGTHWLSVHLKNTGDDHLKNLNVKMHSLDSVHISFRNPNHYIYDLEPDEEKYFEVEAEANKTSHLYISIRGRKNGHHFHWDSGLMREQVLGDPAEIERIFVSSPYSNIDGELEVEAVVKGLDDSNGLGLAFWAETPSGKFEELADMKTRKMSRGDETAYKAKLKPKEDGYYTVYVNLYDDHRNITRAYDTLYVFKNKQLFEDYYSGYYWGNEPYDSSEIIDRRKTDEELKNNVIKNLRKNEKIDTSHIQVYVNNSAVTLKGSVKTYEEFGLAGQAAWNISGVSEVLNDLQVTEPETVGPRRKPE